MGFLSGKRILVTGVASKLSIANGETYHGNTSKDFKPAQPFKFMGVKDLI